MIVVVEVFSCRLVQGGEVDVFVEIVVVIFDVILDVMFLGDEGFDCDVVYGVIDVYIVGVVKVLVLDIIGVLCWVLCLGWLSLGGDLWWMKCVVDEVIWVWVWIGLCQVLDLLDFLWVGMDFEI